MYYLHVHDTVDEESVCLGSFSVVESVTAAGMGQCARCGRMVFAETEAEMRALLQRDIASAERRLSDAKEELGLFESKVRKEG